MREKEKNEVKRIIPEEDSRSIARQYKVESVMNVSPLASRQDSMPFQRPAKWLTCQ